MKPVAKEIDKAAELIRGGQLVAFPTETVYGLGGNALNDRAVAEIFSAKGRPQFNPLIVHVRNAEAAQVQVRWNMTADQLAKRFWPGPLTLVLPRMKHSGVSLLASAGTDTLGVRSPAHPVAQALLAAAEVPLAAPSANRSGRVSPTTAEHVRAELADRVAMILDGGPCEVGLESTVVDLIGEVPMILRPGVVTREEIARALNRPVHVFAAAAHAADKLRSPGMLASHYAPSLPVRLNAKDAQPSEALLAFGPGAPGGAAKVLNLSERANLKEAAAHLFAYLRELDQPSFTGIAVMPIPEEGLGIAINDRLRRAATR